MNFCCDTFASMLRSIVSICHVPYVWRAACVRQVTIGASMPVTFILWEWFRSIFVSFWLFFCRTLPICASRSYRVALFEPFVGFFLSRLAEFLPIPVNFRQFVRCSAHFRYPRTKSSFLVSLITVLPEKNHEIFRYFDPAQQSLFLNLISAFSPS